MLSADSIGQWFLTGEKFYPCSGKTVLGFTPISKEVNLIIQSENYFFNQHLLVN